MRGRGNNHEIVTIKLPITEQTHGKMESVYSVEQANEISKLLRSYTTG